MMNSIVQNLKDERCFLCGRTGGLELHHIMHGTANRRLATRYGLTCWLCGTCHKTAHCDILVNRNLQRVAQRAFEQEYSRTEWMKVFGKNYL